MQELYHPLNQAVSQLRPKERVTWKRNFVWLLVGLFDSRSVHLSKAAAKIPGSSRAGQQEAMFAAMVSEHQRALSLCWTWIGSSRGHSTISVSRISYMKLQFPVDSNTANVLSGN
jgi:hypothetical protein